jgi:hypothetical protein
VSSSNAYRYYAVSAQEVWIDFFSPWQLGMIIVNTRGLLLHKRKQKEGNGQRVREQEADNAFPT